MFRCYSYVGRLGWGAQKLSLGFGCFTKGIAMHEIGERRNAFITKYFGVLKSEQSMSDIVTSRKGTKVIGPLRYHVFSDDSLKVTCLHALFSHKHQTQCRHAIKVIFTKELFTSDIPTFLISSFVFSLQFSHLAWIWLMVVY